MNDKIVTGKILKERGWPEGKIIGFAKAAATKLGAQGLEREAILDRLDEVRASPNDFLLDPIFADVATECLRREKDAARLADESLPQLTEAGEEIVSELREAGLIETMRGPTGGTKLAKPTKEISLLDIHVAAAGKIEPFGAHPTEPAKTCCVGREIKRVLEGVSDRARAAIEKEYAATSLADVVHEMQVPAL